MAWDTTTTSSKTNITTEVSFSTITLTPGETLACTVDWDYSAGPTDNGVVTVRVAANDTFFPTIPWQQFEVSNSADPNSIAFNVFGWPKVQIAVKRNGSTDTIPKATLRYAGDGIDLS